MERSQPAQRVAADVTEHAGGRIVLDHGIQRRIEIAVPTALAQCRRTGHDRIRSSMGLQRRKPEGFPDAVGREFPGPGQRPVQTAVNRLLRREHAVQTLLHKGLTLLQDQDAFTLFRQRASQRARERILRNLQYRIGTAIREVLHQIVVGNAAGNDAEPMVRSFRQVVER